MDYRVLLYYCYTPIDDVLAFREEHHRLCLKLDLRGRIIVAEEGLNGTVSGTQENCEAYMQAVKADARFDALEFKIEEAPAHAFQKLHVRIKPEIVHVGLPAIKPYERTGVHLSPKEFRDMKDRDDVVILDVRSDYEHNLGRFKNAVTLDIGNFREFPEKVEELRKYQDKKILTYCTGGIKCEKASAYLLEQGFENVYQLHGGIIKYGLEAGGEDFEGKCYVFDGRVAVDVNSVNPTVLAHCVCCGQPNERMVNCANPHCNDHVVQCESCGEKLDGACSEACQQHPDKRPYDGTGNYPKLSNHYNPEQGLLSYCPPVR
ncbi:oxygen-dependent tRNA uridine(34) hydroxylase TrhO [Hymenobacter latericus]|uniref:oxygen-dependent tRNA uridine(34) hydroxylase TrhO n=1 Tax=Hymenobacter sp. YIM 151858-1 TaxID=2987688 RepID=UPI002227403A|nr:rhodanese-related sulfurtransferase [Hymenobacter sp. YIM 151858-1]UYZ60432.1 rhodanese-related sulfurtransferase [Hymenobacter sp. YIM 151858-1]